MFLLVYFMLTIWGTVTLHNIVTPPIASVTRFIPYTSEASWTV